MNITLHVWRQKGPDAPGRMEIIQADDISPDMSFLEMLDLVNERLEAIDIESIAFDHDCREGICGMCSLVVNGIAHGPESATTVCQLHMRSFKDGDAVYIEPWRARAFPVIRDLIVDREAFERIQQAGGYVSINCGGSPDANAILVPKPEADTAMDAASCIGCGACVASCPNGSAMLFVAAKIGQFAHLPQGQPERFRRARRMVEQMETEGFGACTNHFECEASCPKEVPIKFISEMNRDFIKAVLKGE
ncbi:MAG: succinate dehydrogenase/fumarate reductase iron-sulfur subunit [Planctomycetes bacterium]|nr:succinate dehydrogenase/fumarate reductase iron-sulfur subunit [Planctomycetota bacterium]MBT4559867.1 succinate dehydrogenase/fumarate reductase iron-sulfur subunit [Planctomycetota bacterium]MBT5100582.1 succinate dehydrogenase/fumarate reductase iron-sulfur subunit [Planctomycetota bacterium]MBT7013145.1 succinate dehydrogenase/fumarate reductase iron-sulfur subunit [Planctomycetota bacterium]MBT7318374.1 succinate dehydrogenase/fumarate reductase iron-sulfur subunit [Planctomycetota bact